jgi:hypothetical protein
MEVVKNIIIDTKDLDKLIDITSMLMRIDRIDKGGDLDDIKIYFKDHEVNEINKENSLDILDMLNYDRSWILKTIKKYDLNPNLIPLYKEISLEDIHYMVK